MPPYFRPYIHIFLFLSKFVFLIPLYPCSIPPFLPGQWPHSFAVVTYLFLLRLLPPPPSLLLLFPSSSSPISSFPSSSASSSTLTSSSVSRFQRDLSLARHQRILPALAVAFISIPDSISAVVGCQGIQEAILGTSSHLSLPQGVTNHHLRRPQPLPLAASSGAALCLQQGSGGRSENVAYRQHHMSGLVRNIPSLTWMNVTS